MGFSVCFLALEYFGWGKYGGIGKATRDIATGLARRDLNVHVVVPQGVNQKTLETVAGVNVHSFPLWDYLKMGEIIKKIDADIYHSQDPSLGTILGLNAMSDSKHVMTCQNPKTLEDWRKVNQFYPVRRLLYNYFIDPYVTRRVKMLDAVYCQCKYIREKAVKCYNLDYLPEFLPNPVKILDHEKKSKNPLICFLGRFDGEKKPERFFELSQAYPQFQFVAAGMAHSTERYNQIRQSNVFPNLVLPGRLFGKEKELLLESSWILVNTSVSECLPVSFLEASAAGCAILSPHDPDGFASQFGYHVHDDYETGLDYLLSDGNWKRHGMLGFEYVKKHHDYEKVISQHIAKYKELLH